MPKPLEMTPFASLEDIKAHFKLPDDKELALGDPSYVQFISHPIHLQSNGDDPVYVQIGELRGEGTYYVLPELAEKANEIHENLNRYHESGDHNGFYTVALHFVSDGTFRIFGTADEDNEDGDLSVDTDTVDEIVKEIAKLNLEC